MTRVSALPAFLRLLGTPLSFLCLLALLAGVTLPVVTAQATTIICLAGSAERLERSRDVPLLPAPATLQGHCTLCILLDDGFASPNLPASPEPFGADPLLAGYWPAGMPTFKAPADHANGPRAPPVD